MRLSFFVVGVLFSSMILAQTPYDIIYKTDGTVLKGDLIERNFNNGQYRIQLANGNMVSVLRKNIQYVVRENTPNEGVQATLQASDHRLAPVKPLGEPEHDISGSLYIGTMIHTLTTKSGIYSRAASYTGMSLASQYHLGRYFALYGEFNIGSYSKLKTTSEVGSSESITGNSLPDETYTSSHLGLILSNNLQQGWQIFTGAGVYSEHYATSDASFKAVGGLIQFGTGYSWQRFQVIGRINLRLSPDYTKAVESSNTALIQMGFHF